MVFLCTLSQMHRRNMDKTFSKGQDNKKPYQQLRKSGEPWQKFRAPFSQCKEFHKALMWNIQLNKLQTCPILRYSKLREEGIRRNREKIQ